MVFSVFAKSFHSSIIVSSHKLAFINLHAFHSLFMKSICSSTLSSSNFRSFHGVFQIVKVNLSGSVPYFSIISRGSIPFPRDLLIFLPILSLTSQCK